MKRSTLKTIAALAATPVAGIAFWTAKDVLGQPPVRPATITIQHVAEPKAEAAPMMPDVPAPTHIVAAAARQSGPETPEAKAVEKPARTGWAVQISSQKQEDAAWSVWKKMQAKHKRLLSPHEANVVQADLGDRGIFYRLRVTGLDDKRQASKLCRRLKKRGTSCFVTRAS